MLLTDTFFLLNIDFFFKNQKELANPTSSVVSLFRDFFCVGGWWWWRGSIGNYLFYRIVCALQDPNRS